MSDPEFILNHNTKTYQFPDWLMRRFQAIHPNAAEKFHYGPYDLLLNEHFKGKDGFMVCPVTYPADSNSKSVDCTVDFEVYMDGKGSPVLILEVKKADTLHPTSHTARNKADQQMRERYDDLLGSCPISRLHGISAFGTKISFYVGDKESGIISPPEIFRPRDSRIADLAPYERWSTNDLLDPRCAYRLRIIFDEIKEECRSIRDVNT